MKLTKKLMLLGAIVANTAFVSQAGAEITNAVEFAGGWKRVKLAQHSTFHEFKGGPAFGKINETADELNFGQFGLRGVLGLPQSCCESFDPCCESFLNLNNIYLRWSTFWGWGGEGNYRAPFDDLIDPSESYVDFGKAKNANTQDYDVAIGFLIPLSCEFGIAPVVGYNYNRLRYSVRNAFSDIDISDLNGARFTSRWEGPYLGFDLGYKLCDFLIAAGYEYHWITSYRGSFRTSGLFYNSPNYLSDNRRGSEGWGNVAHVDLNYNMCGWDLGLMFKYRYYRLTSGHLQLPYPAESFGADPVDFDEYDSFRAALQSYEVNASIGFNF